MIKKILIACFLIAIANQTIHAQDFYKQNHSARKWVRQQFRKLSDDEKIAQLIIIRAHSNLGADHVQQVTDLIKKYNVGGLCFFQGGPIRQVGLTNFYQSIAKTPLMICQDAEWGLGMRLDSIINLPHEMMMGATSNPTAVYQVGNAAGFQCKRIGVNVDFAPVVDVNNNPNNPVINDRSFGENKEKVAQFGVQYMKGIQAENVLACAKHFPGHGDVTVDSHLDLPVINKSRAELDSLELYPFRELIKAGVGSIMTAHLSIPSIDTTAHLATSLSPKAVKVLLKEELGFKGLSITDGLEMKGISKFFPDDEASAQALIAGNDMLLLPSNIEGAIKKVEQAIADHKLSWKQIDRSVKKILLVKYNMGLNNFEPVDTAHLIFDLNVETINYLKPLIAQEAITLLKDNGTVLPLKSGKKIAYVTIGTTNTPLGKRLKKDLQTDNYFFVADSTGTNDGADKILNQLKEKNYDAIVMGVHNYSRFPANNYGLKSATTYLLNQLQQQTNTVTLFFGNSYALKVSCNAPNLLACYEDDEYTQQAAADILEGKASAKGKLPVTVCDVK